MKKIVVEVGSTCTKVDCYDGEKIEHIKTLPIEFKKNYKKENKLDYNDVRKLIELVNSIESEDVFVCGTSIFRQLRENEKEEFLNLFKKETKKDFNIISQEDENIYTVKGATKHVKEALVFVGGGGSTEISYFNLEIKDMKNNKFGVMDILNVFPDLGNDIASTSLDIVMEYIRNKIEVPNIKTDIMILAGGGHEYFARESGIRYKENNLYVDPNETIMMDINTRIEDTKRYYTEISLDEIRKRVEEPAWWYATRAMCAFVLVVAEKVGAKYIIPTDISMIYGII